jgi:hypothetical protein
VAVFFGVGSSSHFDRNFQDKGRQENQSLISSSSSSSPELHVPQPERQKKQPASTTTKPQKPDAKVIGWVDGKTSQAPPQWK